MEGYEVEQCKRCNRWYWVGVSQRRPGEKAGCNKCLHKLRTGKVALEESHRGRVSIKTARRAEKDAA